jgi:hypothetical protein
MMKPHPGAGAVIPACSPQVVTTINNLWKFQIDITVSQNTPVTVTGAV